MLTLVRSHPRLMRFLRSRRSLFLMRRLALIAVGVAVAAFLLFPAAAAWLRQPGATPLPGPVELPRTTESYRPDTQAIERRVRRREGQTIGAGWRPTLKARPVPLAPAPMRAAFRPDAEKGDDDLDDAVQAPDEAGDDDAGDG
jgi:hypothetical protein